METAKKSFNTKIYYDARKFKENSFENNINTINKLYLGLGLKINEIPYIYVDENDNKNYLLANCFTIKTIKEKNKSDLMTKIKEEEKTINYPISFLYNVFFDNNTIFYLDSNNQLNVYKFDKKSLSIKKSMVQIDERENQKNKLNKEDESSSPNISSINDKPISLKIEKNKVEIIMKKLEKINYNNDIKKYYETLCDILEKDLNINLNLSYRKSLKGTLSFIIKESDKIKHICSIKTIKYEIDGSGLIREKIKLQNGIITFKDGINAINFAIKMKEGISYNNTFKSPILFKNFDEEVIPANKVLLFEFKSGFDIEGLHKQFKERIEAVNNFIFNKDEKPLYYIGIVNLNSKNIDKLENYSNYNFNDIKDNMIIVATIDYNFFGVDLSYEINEGYLLIKKIDNLENQISDLKNTMNNLEKKFDDKIASFEEKMDKNFDNLLKEIKALHPEHRFKITTSEKNKNINNSEEKKSDS